MMMPNHAIDTAAFPQNSIISTLLNNISQGVVITTPYLDAPHPKIVYVNRYVLKTTGYTYDELLGASPRVLQGDNTNRETLAKLRQTLESGETFRGETTNYRKDGTPYQVELNIMPIWNGDELQFYLGIQRDITTEKEKEAERLRAETYKLQIDTQKRIRESLANFALAFTQQLRNPLSVIRLNAESINRYDGKLSHARRIEKLHTIIEEVDYLADLLNDVATVSNINLADSDATHRITLSPVNIFQICRDCVERVKANVPGRAADIKLDIDTTTAQLVELDYNLVRHIITHLIVNAVTYSPTGTVIEISLKRNSNTVTLTVTDNGYGIQEENQHYLFDAFYRAPNAINTNGTGLGLTIVKNSVEALNGTISLRSELGRGTTVRVQLPVGEPS